MKRYKYIELLRVLSALAVIAVHVLSHYLGGFPLRSPRWTATMLLKHTTHYCNATFFMISGALLLQPGSLSYRQFIKKRFTRILYPFLFWSFVHYLIVLVFPKKQTFSPVTFFRLTISNGVSDQYWYVYATLMLYLLLPFFSKLIPALSRKDLKIFIGVMALINLIIPFIKEFLKIFTGWPLISYNLASLGSFLTFALIGYYLHTMDLSSRKKTLMIVLLGFVSYVLIDVLCWKASVKSYVNTFGDRKYILVCLMGAGLFTGVRRLYATRYSGKDLKIISLLSENSYTAYLTHMMYLRVIQHFLPKKLVVSLSAPMSALAMAGEFGLAVVLSFGTAVIVHKIPKISRYI